MAKNKFTREDERLQGMVALVTDYISTIDNEEFGEDYDIPTWAVTELIIHLARYRGTNLYEMLGILEECKIMLRDRVIFENSQDLGE